jgi:Txe/YoeB family toxin of Txe-Axe toxin-antitoxin module
MQLKDLNDIEVNEISNTELKRMMTRIINEMKEDVYKHLKKSKRTEINS